MMELLEALTRAQAEFGSKLAVLQPDQWALPTPCDEWDVRYLVAHVIGGNRFAQRVLAGEPSPSAIDYVMSHPQIGDDANADFASTSADQQHAFTNALKQGTLVDHPLGQLTAERFLRMRVFDITVHAWDLAVALDLDHRLDTGLVETVLDIVDTEGSMGFGIRPENDTDPDAEPQERLLNLTGRRHP